jgi:hypothetical protein
MDGFVIDGLRQRWTQRKPPSPMSAQEAHADLLRSGIAEFVQQASLTTHWALPYTFDIQGFLSNLLAIGPMTSRLLHQVLRSILGPRERS